MTAPSGTGKALGVMQSVVTSIDKFEMSGADATLGFYGATATTQPTNAAQAALTGITALSNGFGFQTSAAMTAMLAQLENIRASLVLLGLLKGS